MLSSLFKYLVLLAIPVQVWAELTIFDVRKNLPMSDTEPVYRDFIINGGSETGLSVGMIVTVHRRIPLYDSYQNRSAGDLQVKVAKVKIIFVQKGLAVARMHSEFAHDSNPLLEDSYVMIGDHIDMTSASSDKRADSSSESSSHSSLAKEPAAAPRATAQIVVNSIDISNASAKGQLSPTPPASQKVEQPTLQ